MFCKLFSKFSKYSTYLRAKKKGYSFPNAVNYAFAGYVVLQYETKIVNSNIYIKFNYPFLTT
jgi:predicted nucleotidyltransferase